MAIKSIKVDGKTITFTVPLPQYNIKLSNGVSFVSNTLDVSKTLAQYKALIAVKTIPVKVSWTIKKK